MIKKNITWDFVKEKYPNITEVLDNLWTKQLELYDLLDELEEKYPVVGYSWECNPNDIGSGLNPFYLEPISLSEDRIKRAEERLANQLICVNKQHHFKTISKNKIFWCEYCGTVKEIETEDGLILNEKYYYPEVPHFLPN